VVLLSCVLSAVFVTCIVRRHPAFHILYFASYFTHLPSPTFFRHRHIIWADCLRVSPAFLVYIVLFDTLPYPLTHGGLLSFVSISPHFTRSFLFIRYIYSGLSLYLYVRFCVTADFFPNCIGLSCFGVYCGGHVAFKLSELYRHCNYYSD